MGLNPYEAPREAREPQQSGEVFRRGWLEVLFWVVSVLAVLALADFLGYWLSFFYPPLQ